MREGGEGLIALAFAMQDESRGLVASLTGKEVHRDGGRLPVITGQYGGQPVMVIHIGVGETPCYRERLENLLARERPRLLISAGYVGGLQARLAVGDLVLAENVSEPAALGLAREFLRAAATVVEGALITQEAPAETAEAKQALGAATGGVAVDMETSWVAAVCARTGVPMLSLRVVSDAADQEVPVPVSVLFDVQKQRPRYFALPVWLLCHPGRIAAFVRFVRGVGVAQRHLTDALQKLLLGFRDR